MAKGKSEKKPASIQQRQARRYQMIFIIISVIVIVTFVLQLVAK